jgi:hypothetical protein
MVLVVRDAGAVAMTLEAPKKFETEDFDGSGGIYGCLDWVGSQPVIVIQLETREKLEQDLSPLRFTSTFRPLHTSDILHHGLHRSYHAD